MLLERAAQRGRPRWSLRKHTGGAGLFGPFIFGKTYGCSIWLVKQAWNNKNSLCWWVAPTFSQAKNAYDLIKRLLPVGTYIEYKADLKLVLIEPDGSQHSEIVFKSGDSADGLRGFGVHFFVIDEAARIPYESFVSVMTTITQTMGCGIVISTPNGRGWFYDVYGWGEKYYEDGTPKYTSAGEDPHPEWMSIRMPTWANPHVKLESIEDAKRTLPSDVFRQEFAAEFLDDTAGVFRNVSACIKGTVFEDYMPGHYYVVGVDLARLRDYTVLTVVDRARKHVVYTERFNKVEWSAQYLRIIAVARRYKAVVVVDSTGIGDPIVNTLSHAGLDVFPYKIGGSIAKQQLIEKLRINIDHTDVSFPQNKWTAALLNELRCYEYKFTEGGRMQYEAPSGKHDDCVISLALAIWVADQPEFKYRFWNQRGI